LLLAVSCAGDLRDPQRFQFLVNRDGGDGQDSGASGTAGTGVNPDSGTPDSGSGTGCTPPPAPSCLTMLFTNKCNSSACHGSGAPQVNLVSSGVESRVIGQMSSSSGLCSGMILVTTDGSPSLLAEKVSSMPPCGSQMPLGGSLSSDELTCLTDWVSSVSCGKD
jgi:hypothetical protein